LYRHPAAGRPRRLSIANPLEIPLELPQFFTHVTPEQGFFYRDRRRLPSMQSQDPNEPIEFPRGFLKFLRPFQQDFEPGIVPAFEGPQLLEVRVFSWDIFAVTTDEYW
jgi:hypothetical protein